jgi:hypothetical protein
VRPPPVEAAKAFVVVHFVDCLAALLGGSVARGDATATSDLDVVIITADPEVPYRESFVYAGWPVEAFVHSEASCLEFFQRDAARRRPSLPTMCAEALVLCDRAGIAGLLRREARALLERGPAPPSADEVDWQRYKLTDLVSDLGGARDRHEAFVTASELTTAAADLLLDLHGRWRGRGKWVLRALARELPTWEARLRRALDAFAAEGDPVELIAFADAALELAGGRLFEGFSSGKALHTTSF